MSNGEGFTVKEIVLQTQGDVKKLDSDIEKLDHKLDLYIELHEKRHSDEMDRSNLARSSPKATPAGQALYDDLTAIAEHGRETRQIVNHHDKVLQRLIGAFTLASFLGLGGIALIILQLVGVIPMISR